MFGKAGAALGHCLGPGAAEILLMVPFGRADVAEKVLHRRGVTIEQPAVEVARVPIDQDPAKIKDNAPGHRTTLLPFQLAARMMATRRPASNQQTTGPRTALNR